MRVGVLGPLVVGEGEAATSPRGQRPRDVLAALLQRRGRPVSPDVLLDQVWGEAALGLTPTVVHTVVARLRRQLGTGLVDTHDAGYLVAASTTTDEDAFIAGCDLAARRAGAGDPQGAAAAYREALAWWRSRVPYDGVRDEVVAADRARLVEARAQAHEALIGLLLEHPQAGTPGEALATALSLCAEWPLRENPHRLAMIAAYRDGRQAQALQIYAQLRTRLRHELGVEPAPSTAVVHAQVLAHDPVLNPPSDTPRPGPSGPPRPEAPGAPRASGVPRASGMPTGAPSGAPAERLGVPTPRRRVAPVPVPPSPIVGRTAALQSILGALATGHRLVTVHGPGGVGKTRLLRELGRHLERPDRGGRSPGVVYVDLSGVDARSVDELALTVLTAAGLPTAEEDPVDSVVAAIGSEPLTLLVDEAEWSLDVVVPLVAEILAATPATRLVVTSRVPLDLVGERTVPLGPLACPASGASAAGIRSAPATALLLERLRDHAPDLPVTDADLQLVARIARRVDGLPLALEILAGHAATHSLGDLVDLSEAPLDVAAGGRDRSPRHHSLRDTIAWSATRLGPDAQQALRRLGVFVGSFDTAAAAAVAGLSSARAAAALHELVRDGLLQVDRRDGGSPTRYRMLRTVRDLALDFLSSTGELVDARARHRRWYAAAWRSRPRSDELIRDVQQRHDDFLQALRSALDTRDGASLGDLAMTLSRYWLFANWKRPATAWLTRVIDAGVLDPVDEARIRLQRACHAGNVDPELADGDVTAALPVIEAAGDLLTLVTAHGIASGLASNRGKHPLALEHGHRAVRAARRTTIERTADALGMLATAQAAAGDEAGVVATTGEALDILDRAGSAVARIAVCTNLGIALADVGRPTEALAALERAAVGMPHVLGGRTPAYFDLARGWVLLRCNTAEAAVPAFARALQEVPAGAADPISVETYAGLAAALAAGGYPHGPRLAAEAAELAARTPGSLTPAQHALLEELAGGSLAPRESGSPASALPTTRSLAVRLDAQLRAALTNDTVDTVESAGTIGTAGTDPV